MIKRNIKYYSMNNIPIYVVTVNQRTVEKIPIIKMLRTALRILLVPGAVYVVRRSGMMV